MMGVWLPRPRRSVWCFLGLHAWCPARLVLDGECVCACRHGEEGEE